MGTLREGIKDEHITELTQPVYGKITCLSKDAERSIASHFVVLVRTFLGWHVEPKHGSETAVLNATTSSFRERDPTFTEVIHGAAPNAKERHEN